MVEHVPSSPRLPWGRRSRHGVCCDRRPPRSPRYKHAVKWAGEASPASQPPRWNAADPAVATVRTVQRHRERARCQPSRRRGGIYLAAPARRRLLGRVLWLCAAFGPVALCGLGRVLHSCGLAQPFRPALFRSPKHTSAHRSPEHPAAAPPAPWAEHTLGPRRTASAQPRATSLQRLRARASYLLFQAVSFCLLFALFLAASR